MRHSPEVELMAYQLGDTQLYPDGSQTQYLEFHATGHHWPLILPEIAVAAALHHTGLTVFPLDDVDQLARLVLAGIVHAGIETIRYAEIATSDILNGVQDGQATREDEDILSEVWGSRPRLQRCALAAATLAAHAPSVRRWLPPYPLDGSPY